MSARHILLTGGTGAVGSALIPRLRHDHPDAIIHVVTRRRPSSPNPSIFYHQCDLTALDRAGRELLEQLVGEAELVVHAAADVNWARPLQGSLEANTEATNRLVMLLEKHNRNLKRFVHVSTAFVEAPERAYMGEQQGPLHGTNFANGYEYSKWRAEEIVIASSLPWQIARPSLVVGSTIDGRIARYSGIYYLFRLYAGGLVPVVPCRPDSLIDFVPVNYVAERVLALLQDDCAVGKIEPIVSGSSAMRLTEMLGTILDTINGFRVANGTGAIDAPTLIDPHRYIRFHRPFIERHASATVRRTTSLLNAFLPYLSVIKPFGDHPASAAPDPTAYLPRIVSTWCEEHSGLAMSQLFNWSAALGG